MTIAQTDEVTPQKPLRLWPGVVAVVLQWLVRFVVPVVVPGAIAVGMIGELLGGVTIVVWWLFFSRAPWSERVGAIVLMGVALFATPRIVHKSIATGMMGMMFVIYAIPLLSLAFVAWAVASRRLSSGPRRASMVAAILLGCGVLALVRTGGITGDADSDFHWRWAKPPEDRLLARAGDERAALPSAPKAAETPEKRLPPQASHEPTASRPAAAAAAKTPEKRPVARTGNEPAGFPSVPAATETRALWPGFRGPDRDGIIHGVRIETDWSRSPPVQLWRRPIGPGWSSFAVRGDLLYTQEQRGDDEVVACYRLTTGEPVWRHRDAARFWESNAGAGPRATPTLSDGRVYTMGATGIVNALDARDGSVVWSRNAASDTGKKVPGWGFASSPLVVGDVVIVAAAGALAAYDLATGEERWTSNGLKPYLNDFVVHDGHAFGFDGSILACIDLKDGKRKWKGGRYGHGQLVLLSDQGVLLVLSEEGELVLVAAAPDQFTELARFPAIEGKTWNHPVLVGDVLLVRNGQELAGFRLPLTRPLRRRP